MESTVHLSLTQTLIRSCFTVTLDSDSDGESSLAGSQRSQRTVSCHVLFLHHRFFSGELALSYFITARGIYLVMHCPWGHGS